LEQLGPESIDPALQAELKRELGAAAESKDLRLARLASEALGAWGK
jgi:hypothetical protein